MVYTFYNRWHISYKLALSLKDLGFEVCFIGSSKFLLNKVIEGKYDYVLGLGDFQKGVKKIRLDQVFINIYGKRILVEEGRESYSPTWKLSDQENVYFSDKTSNGPCNRSAYLVSNIITQYNLPTKLAFVHIPKDFSFQKAVETINNWLKEL